LENVGEGKFSETFFGQKTANINRLSFGNDENLCETVKFQQKLYVYFTLKLNLMSGSFLFGKKQNEAPKFGNRKI